MQQLNLAVLEEVWVEQKRFLRDGLRRGDIWDRSTGMSLVGLGASPEVTALFTRLIDQLDMTLSGSGFPALNRYMLINLKEGLFLLINHGNNIMQGMELEAGRVNLGIVFNVAIPKAIARVKQAHAA